VRKQGRVAVIIAVSLAAVALFFLPSLLSLPPVLFAVRDMMAGQLPGTLEVTSCSLGWLGGLRCEQLRYHDPGHGILVEAPHLASDKGLLLLLAAPSYLGEVTIERPTLTVLPPRPGSESSSVGNDGAAGATAPAAVEQKGRGKAPWWEHLTVRVKVNEGQLVLDRGPEPARPVVRQLTLAGSLAMGTIHYDLRFLSAQRAGQLRAKGFINLPLAGQSFLETLVSRAEVEITDLELADFLDLAASRSTTPRGTGVLNATLHLNAAGLEDLEARGETVLRGVRLTGGLLGEDHPQLDQLSFTFRGSHRQGEGWRLSALKLQSEAVRLKAEGSFDGNTVFLTTKGSVDLPVMAAQMPHLLHLHEKTTIAEGTAGFSLDIAGQAEALAIRADCRTERLRLVHDGQPYSWNTPLALVAEADRRGENTTVRTLRVHTPFFEATGSGGIDDFSFQGRGDLDRMFQELKKIFSFDVHAKGQVELSAASKRRQGGGFGLDSRITIHDFALSRGKKSVFPAHDFFLTGKAVAAPSLRAGGLRSLHLDSVFWPGSVSLRAEDMQRNPEQTADNCTLKGAVNLERLSSIVQGLGDGAPVPVLKGNLQFDGTGACEGTQIALRSMQGTVERLAVTGAGYALQEPRVDFGMGRAGRRSSDRQVAVRELTVAGSWQELGDRERPVFLVDLDRRRLEIRRLGWTSAKTVLETDGVIEDWRQPAAGFSVALRGETDGTLLTGVAKAADWLPADVTVKGRARGALVTGSAPGQGNRTELTLEMRPFTVMRGKKQLFTDPRPILKFSLHKEEKGGGAVRIPAFLLQTTPVKIEAAGLVPPNTPPSLELQGQITPDFAVLAPLLDPIIGRGVTANGHQPGEFLLSLPLSLPVHPEQLTFTAHVPVNSLQVQGIGLRQLTLPIDLNRGKLRLRIDGPLDGGRVTLEPVWDLAGRQPVLTLPAATQLLKDVPLKPPLMRGLLGKMHPLFGAVAHPQGMVDVRVDSFSLPMPDKGRQWPTVTAAVGVNRVKFKPTGALRALLDLNGLDQEWFRCKEEEMRCEGKNGRVSCGPVRLLAGEAEVELRGEMDPDGALHYRVRLPVGKPLADKTQLAVQGDVTVEAEISGTRTEPIFDPSAFLASLSAQLRPDRERAERTAEEGGAPPVGEKTSPAEATPP